MIEFWHLPLLFLVALVAGFVDAIAGGGGLLTVHALLGVGLPPQLALGTNKLQASFGSASAAWHYRSAGIVAWRECGRGFVLTFLGAVLGTLAVQNLPRGLLEKLIPLLLMTVAVFLLVKPRLGERDAHPRLGRGVFDVTFGLALGFYDGFFGPGTGTFWAMAFVLGLGFNLTKATGHTKVMNFASNAASLLTFALAGQVLVLPGLVMGLAQWLGARLGSRLTVRHGAKVIRPVFIAIALALSAKLLWNSW